MSSDTWRPGPFASPTPGAVPPIILQSSDSQPGKLLNTLTIIWEAVLNCLISMHRTPSQGRVEGTGGGGEHRRLWGAKLWALPCEARSCLPGWTKQLRVSCGPQSVSCHSFLLPPLSPPPPLTLIFSPLFTPPAPPTPAQHRTSHPVLQIFLFLFLFWIPRLYVVSVQE